MPPTACKAHETFRVGNRANFRWESADRNGAGRKEFHAPLFSLIPQGSVATRPARAARRMFQIRNFRHSAPVSALIPRAEPLVWMGAREAGPLLADMNVRKSTTRGPAGSAANPASTGQDAVRGDAAAERGAAAAFRRAWNVVA
ncbi:hypothetical protein [Burkholderia pyrrocinia]|uniref:hypothetical protein n=1 Tax=Burkholderia pyrrocinia TaxID=60550 RepID=UPI001FC7F7CA|nr:hypothetical protein [Burkholderia pyrrocinia]